MSTTDPIEELRRILKSSDRELEHFAFDGLDACLITIFPADSPLDRIACIGIEEAKKVAAGIISGYTAGLKSASRSYESALANLSP